MGEKLPNSILQEILRDHPQALALADTVITFYGDRFHLERQDPVVSNSSFEMEVDARDLQIRRAIVRLITDGGRVPEALSHELLHLKSAMDGYGILFRIEFPAEFDCVARDLARIYRGIDNLVAHEIFIDQFVGLGFAREAVVAAGDTRWNYELESKKRIQITRDPLLARIDKPFWMLQFLSHHVAAGYGSADAAEAENVVRWGSAIHADLPVRTRQVVTWLDRGRFKDPVTYPAEMIGLYGLMGLPTSVSMLRIEQAPNPLLRAVEIRRY